MEFLMFVLSGFWPWMGFFILIFTAGNAVVAVIKDVRKFQKIDAYQIKGEWVIHIDGARRGDLSEILRVLPPIINGNSEESSKSQSEQ